MTGAEQGAGDILKGGGEMGALMRSYDWARSPLGSVENWSQSLKTAVRIMLTSRQPMFVWWGEALINLYNDAYREILGGKHPQALGQPASYVWREIWDQVGPRAASALLNDEGTYDEALLLIMERNGYPEETYYTFSYSPIPDEPGSTGGIICANTNDTQRIVGERQLALLRELAAGTADARTISDACIRSAKCLETNPYDLPFAMIYLVDSDRQHVIVAGTCGIARNHTSVAETVSFDGESVWGFGEVVRTNQMYLVSDLSAHFSDLPMGAWQRSPDRAVVVPIPPSGQTGKSGILVVGLNPFRLFDDNYQRFIMLISAQIAASIGNAQAYEGERQRAEALAEIDRAKTIFFNNVSHEFRTPLTLMLGPTEDALADLDEPLSPRQQDRIEIVQRNGLRLLKLVNTLLDFSRIEAGRIQATYEPTDLAAFTTDLASVFRSAIERAGLSLVVDCPSLPKPIYVDREMWEKIVLNLLSNAFKFTFTGEIGVSLHWLNDRVQLAVRDTGIGIPAGEIPHLFERFHRVKGARGRTFEGSGIGLSLVQELVKLHGGTVQVSSVVGSGSCFTLSIPTGSAHLPPDRMGAAQTQTSNASGAAPYIEEALRWLPEAGSGEWGVGNGGKLSSTPTPNSQLPTAPARILWADDNADMRDYVRRLLSQQYDVKTVVDGTAALEASRESHFDLILTDVMMPGIDGFELLRQLRADPQTQEIPIILLSARAGEESKVEGLAVGADDYLIKPFSARELLARVEANLKLAQLRQEASRREHSLRKEAETAKQNVETILSSINDGFYAFDLNWRFTYANDRLCEMVGMQRESLLGQSVWDLFPDVVGTEVYVRFQQALTEQTPIQFEYFYPTWQRWYEYRVYPSLDGLTIFADEITERKQAEVALRESEEKFRQMADHAPFMVWVTDPTGYCTYLSQSWYDFTGQTEETGLGFGWLDATHPDDQEDAQTVFLAATERREAFGLEYRLRRKDGEYRWVIDGASPWFGIDGQFKGYIGSVIDISDRKGAEVALRESEHRYRTLFETIDEGFCICEMLFDANGEPNDYRFLEVNPAFEKMTGLEQATGRTARELIPGLEAFWFETYGRVVLTGESVRFENQSAAMNRWFDVNAFRLGEPEEHKFAVLFSNITERKQAELQLQRQAKELNQLNASLTQTTELLLKRNQELDRFVYVVSHDLKAPLRGISNLSEWIEEGLEGQLGEETQHNMDLLRNRVHRLENLIDGLLQYARVGRTQVPLEMTDVSELLGEILDSLSPPPTFTIKVQPNLPIFPAKRLLLAQVFANLISNAIKHHDRPDGRIEILALERGQYYEFAVTDDGIGIAPEDHDRVFGIFQTLKNSSGTENTGIGLSIVKKIVESEGGEIILQSALGQGTTFRFTWLGHDRIK